MSDPATIHLTLATIHVPYLIALFGEPGTCDDDPATGASELMYEEWNEPSLADFLIDASESNLRKLLGPDDILPHVTPGTIFLPFYGHHGAGQSYGGQYLACDGVYSTAHAMGHDGMLSLTMDFSGVFDPEVLEDAQAFLATTDRAGLAIRNTAFPDGKPADPQPGNSIVTTEGRYLRTPKTCPGCGVEPDRPDGEGWNVAVEGARYWNSENGIWNFESGVNGSYFDESHAPDATTIRVFCCACGHYLPLADAFATNLYRRADNEYK